MEEPIRSAVCPDGKLTLEVFMADDYLIGFREHAWHTHGSLLAPQYGSDPKSASLAFFDSVTRDEVLICVSKRQGKEEVWITDDAEAEVRSLVPGETLRLQYWSGREHSRHEKRG
jgi:hypothetical protein